MTRDGIRKWQSADPIGEEGGMNLYAYCYDNPMNLHDPDGMMPSAAWWGGFLDFDQGTLDALGVGAMATADGFIPFSDPFQESGGYSGCEDGAGFSKGAGQVAFGAAALAAGTGVWSGAGLPTMSVGGTVGTGGGFHAFYGVTAQGTTTWMHGVLAAEGTMVVSQVSG